MAARTITTQKPRKWRKGHDGRYCIQCYTPFKSGDLVYSDCAACLHVGCLSNYRQTLIELGLLKEK